MKLKVGDKVRVLDGSKIPTTSEDALVWNEEMQNDVGKIGIVKKVDFDNTSYVVFGDSRFIDGWWLENDWLELVEEEYTGCGDCKYMKLTSEEYPCSNCCHNYMNYYEKMPADDGCREIKWISCKERLPENGGSYLVTMGYTEKRIGLLPYWNGWNRTKDDNSVHKLDDDYITAWAECPKVYKG